VFVALDIQHAMRVRHISICLTVQHFSSLSQKTGRFSGKIFTEYVMCISISLQSLSKAFLILRNYERDIIKNV
jgi:hypothetical protein